MHAQVRGQPLHLRNYQKLAIPFSGPDFHKHNGYFIDGL
jgi:hypothetical protein